MCTRADIQQTHAMRRRARSCARMHDLWYYIVIYGLKEKYNVFAISYYDILYYVVIIWPGRLAQRGLEGPEHVGRSSSERAVLGKCKLDKEQTTIRKVTILWKIPLTSEIPLENEQNNHWKMPLELWIAVNRRWILGTYTRSKDQIFEGDKHCTPCGGEVLHFMFWMSRTKRPM